MHFFEFQTCNLFYDKTLVTYFQKAHSTSRSLKYYVFVLHFFFFWFIIRFLSHLYSVFLLSNVLVLHLPLLTWHLQKETVFLLTILDKASIRKRKSTVCEGFYQLWLLCREIDNRRLLSITILLYFMNQMMYNFKSLLV